MRYYHALLKYCLAVHEASPKALQSTSDNNSFPIQDAETWNDPHYALGAQISPVVVHRAMQKAIREKLERCHQYNSKLKTKSHWVLRDPPDSATNWGISFSSNPAQYIRAMADESLLLNERRSETIKLASSLYDYRIHALHPFSSQITLDLGLTVGDAESTSASETPTRVLQG